MADRREQLKKKHPRVRVMFDIPSCSPGATGAQTRTLWWIEDQTDGYWASFDDGITLPYRIPRKCITDIVPV
jgi:hypothetical protein